MRLYFHSFLDFIIFLTHTHTHRIKLKDKEKYITTKQQTLKTKNNITRFKCIAGVSPMKNIRQYRRMQNKKVNQVIGKWDFTPNLPRRPQPKTNISFIPRKIFDDLSVLKVFWKVFFFFGNSRAIPTNPVWLNWYCKFEKILKTKKKRNKHKLNK